MDFIKIDVEGNALKVLKGMNVLEFLGKHGYKIKPSPGAMILAIASLLLGLMLFNVKPYRT